MSKREKILAAAAGGLVPLVVLCFGFLWLTGALNAYDDQISGLHSQINQAKTLQRNYRAAQKRLKAYQAVSLPSDMQLAVAEYRNWLIAVTDRIFGTNAWTYETPLIFHENSKLRDPKRPTQPPRRVFSGGRIKINVADSTLDRLNQFLDEFYRAPILHRIKTLTITPQTAAPGGQGAGLPTGKLSLFFEIEALALADAEADKTVSTADVVRREHDLSWFQQQIEHRNIFGLPNNPPQITSGNQSEYEGRDIAFAVNARDEDAGDQVSFELLENDIPGAALKQRDPGSKSAQFTAEPLAPGKYSFRVRVTDTGLPNKSIEKTIALEIKAREPEAKVEPKPPFYHARETQVMAILRENDGIDRVWIHIRTLDEHFKLAVGEDFEVDGRKWTVVAIDPRQITLECEGQQRVLRIGDKLSNGKDSTKLSATSSSSDDQ